MLSEWFRQFSRRFIIPGFVCFYLFGLATFVPQASAATLSAPGGRVSDPVVRQADIARPAVVRIITTLAGSLTVHFNPTSQVATFPLNGGGYPLELSGTGAFISAHGDLLTADHVVNPPHDQSMDDYLYQVAADDIANYVNSHFQTTQAYTASDVIYYLENGVFPSTTSYATPTSEVYLSTAYTGPINANKLTDEPASDHATVDRIEVQSSFDEKDVAIIHVSGMDNMPSIQLGDSSQVAELDNLTIIGFPGNGDVSTSPTNLLTSSINQVYVSAMKTTDQNAPVIQVGGNVEHGDSGGPALDANGNIVGIVSFGLAQPTDPGETAFLQASNSAQTLMQAAGVDTTPGSFEKAWIQAFNDYSSPAQGHWHKAARELENLVGAYTGFLGITPYLAYAQDQATREQLPTPTTSTGPNSLLIVGLLVLLVLIIFGIVLFVILRRGARVAPAGAVQLMPTPFDSYGAGSYPPPMPGSIAGSYPPIASYGAGSYSSPIPGTISGNYPPAPASYAAVAWYEQPAGQVPQTPMSVSSPVNQTPLPQPAGQVPQTPLFMSNPLPEPPTQSLPVSENAVVDIPQAVSPVQPFKYNLPIGAQPAPDLVQDMSESQTAMSINESTVLVEPAVEQSAVPAIAQEQAETPDTWIVPGDMPIRLK